MMKYFELLATSDDLNFVAAWSKGDRSFFCFRNIFSDCDLYEVELPSIDLDCIDYDCCSGLIVSLGWEKGTVSVFDSITGAPVFTSQIKQAHCVKVLHQKVIRVLTPRRIVLLSGEGSVLQSAKLKGSIIRDHGDFILTKDHKTYCICDPFSGDVKRRFVSDGFGCTSSFFSGRYLIHCESRGHVTCIDVNDGSCKWMDQTINKHNPVFCGYSANLELASVVYVNMETMSDAIVRQYNHVGECVFEAFWGDCPALALFIPRLNGFITSSKMVSYFRHEVDFSKKFVVETLPVGVTDQIDAVSDSQIGETGSGLWKRVRSGY
jgi:hypothetical protein